MSVILVACNNVNAQTLDTITQQRESLENIPQIIVGNTPTDIQINNYTNKIYVANQGSNSVSVIDSNSGTTKTIRVGLQPKSIAIDNDTNEIYVANALSNTVSVIDGYNDSKIKDIRVGYEPANTAIPFYRMEFKINFVNGDIYLTNYNSDTVSIINPLTYKEDNIKVGLFHVGIAYTTSGHIIYVASQGGFLAGGARIPGTVSVIDGFTHKPLAGVIFKVNPAYSGQITCNNATYPSNAYLYINTGIKCTAYHDKYYYFDYWIENGNSRPRTRIRHTQ